MFKQYFQGIGGIETYPLILLVVFVTFFVGITVWLIWADNYRMEDISKIPLNDSNEETTNQEPRI